MGHLTPEIHNYFELSNQIDRLKKENATLEEQREYLKKQGDELAITVTQLLLENKMLKEDKENLLYDSDQKNDEIKTLRQCKAQFEVYIPKYLFKRLNRFRRGDMK